MSEKPIYIYLGDGRFSLWRTRRKRLGAARKPDPVRAPDALSGRQFAEDERLLRRNQECEADMISLEEPNEPMWELLREFIAKERGW